MFTILTGNPVEGFAAEGLFTSTEDANDYAQAFIEPDTDYWTMAIEPPEDQETDVRNKIKRVALAVDTLEAALSAAVPNEVTIERAQLCQAVQDLRA